MQNNWDEIIRNPQLLASVLRKRKLINFGSFGVIYQLGDVALKIGCVHDLEAEIQAYLSERGLALPVLAACEQTLPPRVVRREVCPVHGLSRDLWEKEGVLCHCDDTLGILVMPLAEAADQDRVASEGAAIDEQVDVLVWDKFGLYSERSPANFVEYQGRLLACDFGIPDFDYW
jgi:hypothetical protein